MEQLKTKIGKLSPEKIQLLYGKLATRAAKPAAIKADELVPIARELNHFPQSYAQQRWWFLEQLMPGAVHNVPLAIEFQGALEQNALR